MLRCRSIYVISGLLLALALPVAQAQTDVNDEPATPARLSVAEGPVSFWQPGDSDWSQAQVNMAVEAGDAIYAGAGATVELQVGPRTFLRLMADTEVSIVRLDAGLVQISLVSGEASLDQRSPSPDGLTEIDAPNAAFTVDGDGYYRVGFRGDTTRFVVRRNGHATLQLRDGYDRTISAGEQIIVRGSDELTAEVAAAPPADAWDRWNDARTAYSDQAASERYVPADVYGAADLDRYGTWSDAPDYGAVWYPTVAAGWAPYTVGRWYWDPVFEWTWIDAEPWGWAPSHYGRWVHVAGRWGWAPGPRVVRPAYAPAVVGFLGFGGGPSVGWVALGWGEPILPWWGHRDLRGRPSWRGWGGPHVVNDRVVDRHAVIDVNVIHFHNSQVSHAVVTVPRQDFGQGREHQFHFATAENGRPAPITGALPMQHERSPAPAGGRQAAPVRGFAPVAPTTSSAPRHEIRSEPSPQGQAPQPQFVPHAAIAHPPRAVEQARPVETPPVERRIEQPAPQPQRVDIAPRQPAPQPQHVDIAPRQEAPQPRRETTIEPRHETFQPQPRHEAPAAVPERESHTVATPSAAEHHEHQPREAGPRRSEEREGQDRRQ